MTFKCASCSFEGVPEEDSQTYGASLREGAGALILTFYMCAYCRMDVDEPLPVRVKCLSSSSNLKESPNER